MVFLCKIYLNINKTIRVSINSNFIFRLSTLKINNNRKGSIYRGVRLEGRKWKKKGFCVQLIKGHPRFAFPRSYPGKVSRDLFALDTKKNAVQDTYSLGEVKILVVATFPENASVCSRCVGVIGICCAVQDDPEYLLLFILLRTAYNFDAENY